ncbi:hypothetical protein [Saccharibacillus kuerlensis]|uniref:Uncharacterized protein n=1 Tax=Saccharibacillus kuerlensis TaxID=459527 RepID=A0ABQ2LA80_9BACL|nr:hypothetical protein [Saccharibacillus kuerlensis]GGO08375.1 hypothetical protein GCM10010969_37800 [Saccharibacillus kuerlensis]
MANAADHVQLESLEALRSAVRKSEAALEGMSRKGASLTLIEKRLRGLRIGLAVLEETWNGTVCPYGQEEMKEAREMLKSLLPSVESSLAKSKAGSPQRTLIERRMTALKLAVDGIDQRL